MNFNDIITWPFGQILDEYPFARDFFSAFSLPTIQPDQTLGDFFDRIDREKIEASGLDDSKLIDLFHTFLQRMEGLNLTSGKAIHCITIFGGRDKRGRPENMTLELLAGEVTAVVGPTGSGKSLLAFQFAVNVQLPKEKGGLDGHAIWIDTEGTFRPARIEQLASVKGLDPKEVLNNIKIGRAYSSDHQILLVDKVPELVNKDPKIKLIVVDSMMALFRAEYVGRGTLADRQQKINVILHNLQRLADRYNLAVYMTNQVMARPDMMFGDPTAPVGGHIIGHVATYRIYLRKGKKGLRVAKLVDSPSLPEGEVTFQIGTDGITDAEEEGKKSK